MDRSYSHYDYEQYYEQLRYPKFNPYNLVEVKAIEESVLERITLFHLQEDLQCVSCGKKGCYGPLSESGECDYVKSKHKESMHKLFVARRKSNLND